MRIRRILLTSVLIAAGLPLHAQTGSAGQTPVAATAPTAVPALIPYAGIAETGDGKAPGGEISATFMLFKDESGGEPLWTESQRLTVEPGGRYHAQLGAASPMGLPLTIFASGEARWLEVQIAGEKQTPRVLLMSVPYAAKSADASTLGGLPASAFLLAGTRPDAKNTTSTEVMRGTSANVTTPGGTTGYLPLFSSATAVVNSEIVDTGTSVGIGHQPNPIAKLDVDGPMIMRGNMTVSRTGNATASTGYPSYGFDFFSNAYDSSTKATDNPHFQLQSEPVGNNTGNTSATFNLLYSNHGTAPVETGLSINPSGVISFAAGQMFPGVLAASSQVTLSPPGGSSSTASLIVNGYDGTVLMETGSPGILSQGGNYFPPYSGYASAASGGDGGDFLGGEGGGPMGAPIGSDGGRFYGGIVQTGASGASSGDGIYAEPGSTTDTTANPGNAATLNGNVSVAGTLDNARNDLKIDHPLDPANKYLVHSSVESSEMMNIYTGNVVTDDLGIATVTLPDWFETLNADFRYQLTTIGRDAHAWIAEEVADHHFRLATNAAHVKVSWQITAVRQDVYAKAHPLVVEQEKVSAERGFYLHPELYGQPAEKQIEWGRHPDQMRRMKTLRDAPKSQPTNNVRSVRPAGDVHRVSAKAATP